MKKYLFMAAAAAAVLTSCSSDETLSINSNNPDEIKFSAKAENATRAENVYCSNNLPDNFNVYATIDGTSLFIDGDIIVKNGNTYENSVSGRMWPQLGADQKVSFYGIKNATFKFNSGAAPSVNFSTADAVENQVDFLYAYTQSAKTKDAVAMNFRHALCQVVFNVANTNKTLNVKVNEVGIKNVYANGTYTYPTAPTVGTIACDATTDAYSANRGSWANFSNATDYAVTTTLSETGEFQATALTTSDHAAKNFGTAMLLIPTSYAKAAKNEATGKLEGAYFYMNVEITQQIKNEDGDALGEAVTIYTGTIAVPYAIDWKEGMKYTYTFTIGEGEGGIDPENPDLPVFLPINFSCAVDDFVTDNVENIELNKKD